MNLFIYLMSLRRCQKRRSVTFTSLEEGLQREDWTGNESAFLIIFLTQKPNNLWF